MDSRFVQMRRDARRAGKFVPEIDQLREISSRLVDMACPQCGVKMGWKTTDLGRGQCVSLQHWRDGSVSLICFSCNSSHASFDNDEEFKNAPKGKFRCPKCRTFKDPSEFNANKKRGLQAYCRPCSKLVRLAYESRHPERIRERWQACNAKRADERRSIKLAKKAALRAAFAEDRAVRSEKIDACYLAKIRKVCKMWKATRLRAGLEPDPRNAMYMLDTPKHPEPGESA